MIRAFFLALALCLAGPLLAQTATDDSDAPATAESDASDSSGEAEGGGGADDQGIDADAVSTVEEAGEDRGGEEIETASEGRETGRPVPASPEGIKGLENPDASAFVEGRRNNTALLADRRAPASYPTLDTPDDDGGALDGAATAATLDEKKADRDARAIFTALAGRNCRIAARDVATTLGPMGFEPEVVTDTLARLIIEGAASLDAQGNLTLPASLCPPDDPAPSPRDTVIAALRSNDCSMGEDELRGAPGVSDLSEAQLLAILGPMRERGEIETGTLSATLSQELCQED